MRKAKSKKVEEGRVSAIYLMGGREIKKDEEEKEAVRSPQRVRLWP